ncbi:MAG TPA: DNA polymerase III subunit beta [Gaiellaceae bacterium]|jgi:DNA polymerase-3 subunit beta|nr:DNA polymerase III subunit beta [Gaiellaceae bacterium]
MTSMDTVVATRMKVTCPREELAQKLGVVGRAVSSRTSVNILTGIMLRAESGQLSLAATDMEISLRVTLDAQVEEEGSVVIPGRLLVDIVRLLPAGEVTLEHRAEEGIAHLVCGSASYGLHTYSPDDFPRLPEIAPDESFSIERAALLDTIMKVSRSASRDESRPVLTGVLVRFEAGKLIMAATDSYRLSVKETEITEGPAGEIEAIVPARALSELARIAQASDADSLTVGIQENQIVFAVDDVWLTARRIDGQFPNYRQLLPETFEAEVELPREELLDVVRRTGLMAQRKSPLRLRFEEGQLTISAQTQDVGEAHESLPAAYTADPIEIGFNAEFLRDGLESLEDDQVRLRLISPLRPGLIQGAGDDFLYLIMPIRLAG